jgi:hypothetical protein
MNEKVIVFVFSIIIIVLFSLNFHDKWINRNYEILKDKKGTWFWFKTFNIKESKENFVKFIRGLSAFVISIMIISIILVLVSL